MFNFLKALRFYCVVQIQIAVQKDLLIVPLKELKLTEDLF